MGDYVNLVLLTGVELTRPSGLSCHHSDLVLEGSIFPTKWNSGNSVQVNLIHPTTDDDSDDIDDEDNRACYEDYRVIGEIQVLQINTSINTTYIITRSSPAVTEKKENTWYCNPVM